MSDDINEIVIHVSNLTKKFGDEIAVNEVSFDVRRGETLALIGTSGSGKTTILKSINALIPRTSGSIKIFGRDIDDWDPVLLRRKMGYVIQQVGLFPHYSIEKNVRLIPELLGWKRARIDREVSEWLSKVHIPDIMRKKYPEALSGGQQQRVGLARALVADPEIILMDEPFGALDPIIRAGMQQEFRMINTGSKAVVFVTHDMQEAAMLATRICLLDKGSVQQTGTLNELLFAPANNFVTRFLDANRDSLEMMAIRLGDIRHYHSKEFLENISDDLSLHDLDAEHKNEARRIYYLHRDEIIKNITETRWSL